MKREEYGCAGKSSEGKPSLSIVIPIYNVEAYLPQCLDSIVGQLGDEKNERTEVILVDDGSTDRSGKIADDYADACSCVRVIHKKNAGVAAARNTGMEEAAGRWLYFMDSDDWMAQDGIGLLLLAAADCPQEDLILLDAWQNAGGRERPWEHFEGEVRWDSRQGLQKLQRGVLYYPMDFPGMKVSLAAPWDKLYRRGFLERNQLRFREELHVLDDMIFNMEALGKAQKAAYKKYKVCHYRQVSSSITNRFRADRVEEDTAVWRMISKYYLAHFSDAAGEEERAQAEAFHQAYLCRVIRSFAICCRLCFYHRDNGRTYRERQKYVRSVAKRYSYREAFSRVKTENLEWKLRAVVFLVRHDLFGGLYLLYLAEMLLRVFEERRIGRQPARPVGMADALNLRKSGEWRRR